MKITSRCKLKHIPRLVLTGLMISALLFAAGCVGDQALDAESVGDDNNIVNGKDVETVTGEIRAKPEGIPPIDGHIPEDLRTATFAMG